MARALIGLLTVGVAVYAAVDCLRSRADEVRYLPRFGWLATIVIFPLAGAAVYLLFGRVGAGVDSPSMRPMGGAPTPGRRPIAPDDDPDFLRSIKPKKPRDDDGSRP